MTTGSRRNHRYLQIARCFAPSGRTTQLSLVLLTVIGISWLFLHYGKSELIEKVLLVSLGGLAAEVAYLASKGSIGTRQTNCSHNLEAKLK